MITLHPRSRGFGSTLLLLLYSTLTTAQNHDYDYNSQNERTYGLDISFPITTPHVSTNFDYLPHNNVEYASPSHPNYVPVPQEFKDMALQRLGDRQDFYDHFMEGCRHHYAAHAAYCDESEEDRLDMNYRQPSSMMNYTELGFAKVTAPKKVFAAIQKFWKENSGHGNEQPEDWDEGNTYTNHWDSPTFMLDIEDPTFTGGGSKLQKFIWDGSKRTLEEWTGQTLQPCSLYGIRKYTEGAVLAPHVDRLPLVTSAIINVAQDLDEPWVSCGGVVLFCRMVLFVETLLSKYLFVLSVLILLLTDTCCFFHNATHLPNEQTNKQIKQSTAIRSIRTRRHGLQHHNATRRNDPLRKSLSSPRKTLPPKRPILRQRLYPL